MKLFNKNGYNIHYRFIDHQKKNNFLLINSLGTDFRIWDSVIPAIEAFGNVILYDKRGHGLSDFAPAKNGLEDYADDARDLLSELKIQNCIPIGISVGGMIAQILANKNPGLVSKLILCDTAHKIGNDQTWNDRISQVQNGGIKTISDAVMKRWFSVSFHQEHGEIVAGYKNMLERCPVHAYIQTCEAIRDADLTEISKSIQVPTLCIVGVDDLSTSPAEVESMSKLIRGAKFEIISDSAHLPCIDSAEKFNKLITDFLK